MTAQATPDRESRSSDEIFRVLSVEFSRNVVTRALQHRPAAKGVRKQLNARVRRLRLDGFRDASRAPHQRLLRPILDAIERGDQPLARAVLNTWMESHEALRHAAAAHLADRGMPTPDPPDACFESSWTIEEWLRERRALTADDGALGAEDGTSGVRTPSLRLSTVVRARDPLADAGPTLKQAEIDYEGSAVQEKKRPARTRPRSLPQPLSTYRICRCFQASGVHAQGIHLGG